MKITQDVRDYAESPGLKEEEALTRGDGGEVARFVERGAEVYAIVR